MGEKYVQRGGLSQHLQKQTKQKTTK